MSLDNTVDAAPGFRRVAAAVTLALVATACAGAPPPPARPRAPQTFTFVLVFEKGCPVAAEPAKDTPPEARCAGARDCLRLQPRDRVQFATQGDPDPATRFGFQFDPFGGRGTEPMRLTKEPYAVRVDLEKGKTKIYTFSVVSDPPTRCRPLDPTYVITEP